MSTDNSSLPPPSPERADSPTYADAGQTLPELPAPGVFRSPADLPLPPLNDVDDIDPTIGTAETREHRQRQRLDHIMDLLKTLMTPAQRLGALGRLDNYEILDVVGQGAMGVVVRAHDETLHRIVAIKLMAPHLLASANAKERFFREARAAAGISHPNVVTIHAVAETRGVPYLVMEYIEGQSLDERIHLRPLDTADVLRIAQQMAAGLSAAHRHGLIHRDIKPSNVLLEDSIERVRIADFGLARVAMDTSELTSAGQIVGTPAYMSPEQVNGERLDPRSDLFSMGCVMYAMFAGHSPFQAPNGLVASRLVLTKEPEPLASVCDRAPPFLCEIIHRLLTKNPKERYQSADELSTVLTRHLRTWDSYVNTPTIVAPQTQRNKTYSLTMSGLAVVAVIVAGAIAYPYLPWTPTTSSDLQSVFGNRENPGSMRPAAALPLETSRQPLTVARDGTARFVTIADAVAAAAPGDLIQIRDAGPYVQPLELTDPARLRGVKILGNASVITAKGATVIRIAGVPDLSIDGLVVNALGYVHGLEVVGDCPGLTIQNSVFQSAGQESDLPALIYFHNGAAGTVEKPIVLQNLDIRFSAVGIVVGDETPHDPPQSVRHLQIIGSHIRGLVGSQGYSVIGFDGLEDVDISRNLVENGDAPLSFNLLRADSVRRFQFTWNTIRDHSHAMHVNGSELSQLIRIGNNLLLNVANPPFEETFRLDQLTPWFTGNVWQHPPDEREIIERIAERRDQVDVKSNAPGSPDYLVPVDKALQAGRSRWRP